MHVFTFLREIKSHRFGLFWLSDFVLFGYHTFIFRNKSGTDLLLFPVTVDSPYSWENCRLRLVSTLYFLQWGWNHLFQRHHVASASPLITSAHLIWMPVITTWFCTNKGTVVIASAERDIMMKEICGCFGCWPQQMHPRQYKLVVMNRKKRVKWML